MTKEEVKDLARHIPTDEGAVGVVGVTPEEWFVVGPRCLELWWQFKGPRYPHFVEPYVRRILSEIEEKS